jgi:hypothetical protein
VAGFSLVQQLAMLQERVLMFQPDAVFITDSPRGNQVAASHLLKVVASRIPIPFPRLDELVRETGVHAVARDGFPVPFESMRAAVQAAGVQTRMPWLEAERRIRLAADPIGRWTLERIAQVTQENGAVPAFVALDNVADPPSGKASAVEDARAIGFLVFNLLDLWEGHDKPSLHLGEWDRHPNAAGNRLIAERLFELVRQHRSELRIDTADGR